MKIGGKRSRPDSQRRPASVILRATRIEGEISWYKLIAGSRRLLEYGLRVRLTSVGDGVPQGVEYRPPVGVCSDAGPFRMRGATGEDRIHLPGLLRSRRGRPRTHAQAQSPLHRGGEASLPWKAQGLRRAAALQHRSQRAQGPVLCAAAPPYDAPGCRHGIHYIKMFP